MTTLRAGSTGTRNSSGDTFVVSVSNEAEDSIRGADVTGVKTWALPITTGKLNATNDTWTISGSKAGNLTTGALAFTGMSSLNDAGSGKLNSVGEDRKSVV